MGREILILRQREILELFDPTAYIAAMEQAFAAYSGGRAELASVIHLAVPEHRGEVHIKAGHIHGNPYYAVKMVSGFPGNIALGLPANDGMVVAFDASTGAPAAFLLDHGLITDLRTAAAGAVAAKHLARREIRRVAVIGTGGQARYQMEMLAQVRSFRQLLVWGRNRDRARARMEDLEQRGNLPANCQVSVAETLEEAVAASDIVVTVTASREPLVRAEWLKLGATVIAVGSDAPDKQELEVDVLARADRIVADSTPQCLRLGEIHHAVEQGAIPKEKVSAELGEIVAGQKPGRRSENEIIVCDLTGVGVQDVAAASFVIRRAQAASRGQHIALPDPD
jgi:ornithine cyclodeaminase/alanine dehydrogenase-like protein (mu-crystallin family)